MTKSDSELTAFLNGVVGAVEANSYEHHSLWADLHQRDGRPWEQNPSGMLRTVGQVDGRPICVSILTALVDGHKLLFYHATSQVVDHGQVDDWLKKIMPDTARFDGAINKSDATNFSNLLHTARGNPKRECPGHDFRRTDNWLVDRCMRCGEERA